MTTLEDKIRAARGDRRTSLLLKNAKLVNVISGEIYPADRDIGHVVHQLKLMRKLCRDMGCRLRDPFMALSFLSLPVIPELRVTDRGLVDASQFRIVPLFGE